MRIACDLEGVLADIDQHLILDYNNMFNENKTVEDHADWTFKTGLTKLTPELFLEITRGNWLEKWREIPPMEDNLAEKLSRLNNEHYVDIVTSRTGVDQQLQDWLKLYNISYQQYVVVPLGKSKADQEYEIFIDDSPFFPNDFARQTGKYLLLRDRPYNRHVQESKNVRRVRNLDDAFLVLSQI